MSRIKRALSAFFRPPPGSSLLRRLLPFASVGLLIIVMPLSAAYVWDYTNSPEFCGKTCHTMPPEYTAYLTSPHARILCVECHIGRDFIATRITRKIGDLKHVFATLFQNYEFPIQVKDLRPAREICERCHSPEKFADDSLREIVHFGNDVNNTPSSIYLTLKTGGGSRRQGLGRGIHWHIESQVYYMPLDENEQQIPFVRVINDDGSTTDYVDLTAGIDAAQVDPKNLKEMDCITCHNRITHLILPPDDSVDQLLSRNTIDRSIPEIRLKAVEVLGDRYNSVSQAMDAIAGLKDYYQQNYAEFYATQSAKIDAAVTALQEAYRQSAFPEQKADWTTHADNVGHRLAPGCFRCHDGKHLDAQKQAIRLECNLCHSIPVVAGPDKFVVDIEIARGPEPESHRSPNWLALHRDVFDASCSNCHTTSNPGGTDNSSFCSNSGCHGNIWQFAGLNAPGLRDLLKDQLPAPTPEPVVPTPAPGAQVTYKDVVGPLFTSRCGSCHGEGGIQGLNLTTYQAALAGGQNGPVIVPGDPEASLLVQKQSGDKPHFSQLTPDELQLVVDWIAAGAPEK